MLSIHLVTLPSEVESSIYLTQASLLPTHLILHRPANTALRGELLPNSSVLGK